MSKTKVTAASDIHGQWYEMRPPPPADILVFAGDVTSGGRLQEAMAFLNWAKQFSADFADIIMIPGNHDRAFEVSLTLLVEEARNKDIEVLIDRPFDAHGVKVFGSPWSKQYGSWAFMARDQDLERKYIGVPEDTELLISHGPPYDILDLTQEGDKAGSKSLLALLERLTNLKAFICGHIHEAHGSQLLKTGGVAYNVASMTRKYQMRQGTEWTNFTL